MKSWIPFEKGIDLFVDGRISRSDASRQALTAREILKRFHRRPGVILADEVGMGKTFVSLAVATSVALGDPEHRPVVVMIPSGLKQKWPRDFDTFSERCLSPDLRNRVRCGSAETGVGFLKLLDDSPDRRRQIIFLTHGAMQRAMNDPWVRLSVIRKALYRRRGTDDLKRSLAKCLGKLVPGMKGMKNCPPEIWIHLLSSHPEEWLSYLKREGYEPADNDDPVPRHLIAALEDIGTDDVYEAVQSIPQRVSSTYEERLRDARQSINAAIDGLWTECVRKMHLRLPLLILDEAHHLKNARTRLASLFQADTDGSESKALNPKGSMGGVFDRMLFLTATPFQLGHHELCAVIDRFEGINWTGQSPPGIDRESYRDEVLELRGRLDRAQSMALSLSETWGRLTLEDLTVGQHRSVDAEDWWQKVQNTESASGLGKQVVHTVTRTKEAFNAAESLLRPWVIRHLRDKVVVRSDGTKIGRRKHLVGSAIQTDNPSDCSGLPIRERALLPFLLAARATLCRPDERPVFAEGLASSYESFLHTRNRTGDVLDLDESMPKSGDTRNSRANWYLKKLENNLPLQTHEDSAAHPKIAATAERVIHAWRAGEKVVVFCHFVRTGYALRRAISGKIRDAIAEEASRKLKLTPTEAFTELEDIGSRFFDSDTKARQEITAQVDRLLAPYPALSDWREVIQEVVRRFLRTPSFLVRFFPLENTQRLTAESVQQSFASVDDSGLTLTKLLEQFFEFLAARCSTQEREEILEAVNSMQTGGISDRETSQTFSADEEVGQGERLMPNVRLVNGRSKQETRQRLMLTFNSPFFPEVLIASAVMAEGVDLHRYCRYVIHHDLCWNPSTLEQRTGRIDRIGAKVETSGRSIHLYKPFLSPELKTSDNSRSFRIVSDGSTSSWEQNTPTMWRPPKPKLNAFRWPRQFVTTSRLGWRSKMSLKIVDPCPWS